MVDLNTFLSLVPADINTLPNLHLHCIAHSPVKSSSKITMDAQQKAGLAGGLGVVASSILIGIDVSRSPDTMPPSFPSSIVANMPKELPNGLPMDPPDVLVGKMEQGFRRRRLLNAGLAVSGSLAYLVAARHFKSSSNAFKLYMAASTWLFAVIPYNFLLLGRGHVKFDPNAAQLTTDDNKKLLRGAGLKNLARGLMAAAAVGCALVANTMV